MPLGMFLKSEPYGSVLSSATRGYDIATYSRLHGFDYVDRVGPLSIERFLGYADWFADQLVPDVRDLTVTNVTPDGGGFKVEFAEDSPVLARQVIVATGLIPYTHIPGELSGLPSDLVTHSSVHHRMDQFRGRRVAVVGGGQSALQTGALLHEAGAEVQIIVRKQQVIWDEPIAQEIGLLDYILRPPAKLCEGWGCAILDSPDAFRLLPKSMRIQKALTSIGPHGAWWLRDRVEGVVEMLTEHSVKSAEPDGNGVRLLLDGPKQSSITADHVIAGTGFRIDVARLPFMSEGILAGLVTRVNCPLVNRAGESTIPGLYFSGAHTLTSLGPGVKFISGAHTTAAQLARSVARRARKGSGRAGTAASRRPLASAAGRDQSR
jgi:NADPH-dependent 2,4-dienoyl-CoA reductase/sulfur reductase-like enzyme